MCVMKMKKLTTFVACAAMAGVFATSAKRSLVVRPEEAIGDDVVQCCLCGRGFQNLTAKHLLSHGISVDEYKKLCGYVPEQKLICKNLLEKLQENVQKAQRSREQKLSGEHLK